MASGKDDGGHACRGRVVFVCQGGLQLAVLEIARFEAYNGVTFGKGGLHVCAIGIRNVSYGQGRQRERVCQQNPQRH